LGTILRSFGASDGTPVFLREYQCDGNEKAPVQAIEPGLFVFNLAGNKAGLLIVP